MKVHEHRAQVGPGEQFVHRQKGVVGGVHEDPAQRVHHRQALGQAAVTFHVETLVTAARCTDGHVQGPHQPGVVEQPEDLPMVPGVVAQRDTVGPRPHDLAEALAVQAKTPGGVLTVHDHEMKPAFDGWKVRGQHPPPWFSVHITHEQNTQHELQLNVPATQRRREMFSAGMTVDA